MSLGSAFQKINFLRDLQAEAAAEAMAERLGAMVAGRIAQAIDHLARLRRRRHRFRHAMRGKDHRTITRHLVQLLDENRPLGAQPIDHLLHVRLRSAGLQPNPPAAPREQVRRAYLDGWSYEELARDAGVPLNTMKTWLRRSLQRLRDCMDQFTDRE